MSPMDKKLRARLNKIAKEIKDGASAESFKKQLDKLLNAEMPTIDESLDTIWESSYRKNGRL